MELRNGLAFPLSATITAMDNLKFQPMRLNERINVKLVICLAAEASGRDFPKVTSSSVVFLIEVKKKKKE